MTKHEHNFEVFHAETQGDTTTYMMYCRKCLTLAEIKIDATSAYPTILKKEKKK